METGNFPYLPEQRKQPRRTCRNLFTSKPAQPRLSPFRPKFKKTAAIPICSLCTLGLRYGLTSNTDIYGSGSYLWHEERKLDGNGKTRNKRMSDISLDISHTFLKDDKNPALISFLESTVYEKSRNKASSGKSWLIGATTYKAIDPVVLSLTAAYRINGSKTLSNNTKYKASNYWMLNPNISSAANDRISLTGGIQWLGKQPDRLDGKKETTRNTSTYAHFGAGFGFTKTTALNASARFNVSGQSSSELKFGVQQHFKQVLIFQPCNPKELL